MEMNYQKVEQWAHLNQLPDKQITLLSNIIFSFLANPSQYDIQENLVQLSDEIQMQPADFKKLVQSLLVLLNEAFTGLYSAADLEQRCLSAGIESVRVSAIVQAWSGKYAAAVATDDCDSVGKTYVQLKLGFLRPNATESTTGDSRDDGISSDGISSGINSGSSGSHVIGREQVFVEMNLEQFYQFLASIEKCKSCIELFNPST